MKTILTMPIYAKPPVKILLASLLISALSACSTSQITPKPSQQEREASVVKEDKVAPTEPQKTLTLDDYLKSRSMAAANGDWAKYLQDTNAAWYLSAKPEQQKLTNQAWSIVKSLSAFERNKLQNSADADVQAWFYLFEAFKNGSADKMALMNLTSFDKNAIFNQDLLPQLIASQPEPPQVRQIAVLLPMQDKYKVVSEQIRNGILKAFYAADRKITLKFYDSSDLNELENIYTQAKEEGADRIIGPLRKSAVQTLASFHDDSMLALNNIDSNAIKQFSFKSADPAEQMVNRFNLAGYERIGIMTSDDPRSVAQAQALKNLWQQISGHQAELSIYPDNRPKLRDALGQLIHENLSKERRNNIRWAMAEKIEYFPRTRQDLQAIVILDSARRLAVFRPQFDFFGLEVPLYSDSQLSPTDFQNQTINKDLKDVTFLSYPAVLQPEDLQNKFEAFGWDSFIASIYSQELADGACISLGKTGVLSQDDNLIQQTQIWVTYNREGMLEEAPLLHAVQIDADIDEDGEEPQNPAAQTTNPAMPTAQ